MKNKEGFYKYLRDERVIAGSESIIKSFENCFEFFEKNKNLTFFDKDLKALDAVKDEINPKKLRFSLINKKDLAIFNQYFNCLVDYLSDKETTNKGGKEKKPTIKNVVRRDEVSLEKDKYKPEATKPETASPQERKKTDFSAEAISNEAFESLIGCYHKKVESTLGRFELDENREEPQGREVDMIIFDLIHDNYIAVTADSPVSLERYELPSYFYSRKVIQKTNPTGDYSCKNVFTSASCFKKENFEKSVCVDILSPLFKDVYEAHRPSPTSINLCVIPDSIDEFNVQFRRMAMSMGNNIFLVPESIIYATGVMLKNPTYNGLFAILDMDGEEPTLFEFRIDQGTIVRRGRKRIQLIDQPYAKFSEAYISKYLSKNSSDDLDENEKSSILCERKIDGLFANHSSNFLARCKNGDYILFKYDADIASNITVSIQNQFQQAKSQYGKLYGNGGDMIFCISSLAEANGVLMPSQNFDAIKEIIRRCKSGNPIWKEEIPRIELQVENSDKSISYKRIVGENVTQPIIVGQSQTADMVYPVDGQFKLKAFDDNGVVANHTNLPMKRDVLGAFNTKKDAVFLYPNPLSEDLPVHLSVHFNYGKENVFNLVAVSDDGTAFESTWEDKKPIEMKNEVSAEIVPPDERKDVDEAKSRLNDVCWALKSAREDNSLISNGTLLGQLSFVTKKRHYQTSRSFRYSNVFDDYDLEQYLFSERFCQYDYSIDCSRVGYLLDSYLFLYKNYGLKLRELLELLGEYICKFSCIPLMVGPDAEYPELGDQFKEVAESILSVGGLKSVSSLLMVSKEVGSPKDDCFGLFGLIKEITCRFLVNCKPGDKIFDNYSCDIAAYAWDNEKWLKTLYKIFKGTSLFDYVYLFMINKLNTINCLDECKNTALRSIETKTSDSQLPRPSLSKVRDQIECALAFINIRDTDNHYFDPNLDETENFEDRLLALSNEINKCMEKYLKPGVYDTRFTFKSRLMSDEEEAGGLVETIGLLRKAIGGQEDIINLKFEDA